MVDNDWLLLQEQLIVKYGSMMKVSMWKPSVIELYSSANNHLTKPSHQPSQPTNPPGTGSCLSITRSDERRWIWRSRTCLWWKTPRGNSSDRCRSAWMKSNVTASRTLLGRARCEAEPAEMRGLGCQWWWWFLWLLRIVLISWSENVCDDYLLHISRYMTWSVYPCIYAP